MRIVSNDAPWALLQGSPIPIVVHLDNQMVIVTTDHDGRLAHIVQVHEGSRVCWVVGNPMYPADVYGCRSLFEEAVDVFDPAEYLGRGTVPLEREDQLWMLGVMRRLESPRHQTIRPWFRATWQQAKTLICQALPFEMAGKRVWWGADIRVRFKKTDEGMIALGTLYNAIRSETRGFNISRAGLMDMELTITSGTWSEALAISWRDEYVITLTADFYEGAAVWFTQVILPALEEFEVQ